MLDRLVCSLELVLAAMFRVVPVLEEGVEQQRMCCVMDSILSTDSLGLVGSLVVTLDSMALSSSCSATSAE